MHFAMVIEVIIVLVDFAVFKYGSGTITCLEADAQRCSLEMVFLAISQN